MRPLPALLLLGLFPALSLAQMDLESADVFPLTAEIKPWPEYEVGGNGFNSLDMSARAKGLAHPGVNIFGHDAISPCGPIQMFYEIHPIFGLGTRRADGILLDGKDHEDPQGFLGAVVDGASDTEGFGIAVSGGGYYSIMASAPFSFSAFRMADFSEIISPTNTISATSYVNSNSDMHLVQIHSRINAIAGQSIPAGTIENHPSRTPGTGASRSCGIEALVQDQVVVVTEDRTGGDPGAVFGFSNPGKPIIVISIYDDDGSVLVPSFAYPHAGRNSPARQSVAEGRVYGSAGTIPLDPWFIVRTAVNTATVFDDGGSVVKDLGDYLSGAPLPPGIVSLEPGGEERAVAAGRRLGYIAVRGMDGLGRYHPCVVVVEVEEDLSDASVINVLQADDDLTDPPDFSDPTAMDLYAQPDEGNLFVAWRNGGDGAPVARFYDADQNPMSPTFWVSTFEENDQNSGEHTIKCAADDTFAGVAWYSESFNPGLNCRGEQMERDTVFRLFHPPWAGEPPTATPTPTSTATPTPTYATDINLDGNIDAEDLLILLEDWGKVSGAG